MAGQSVQPTEHVACVMSLALCHAPGKRLQWEFLPRRPRRDLRLWRLPALTKVTQVVRGGAKA